MTGYLHLESLCPTAPCQSWVIAVDQKERKSPPHQNGMFLSIKLATVSNESGKYNLGSYMGQPAILCTCIPKFKYLSHVLSAADSLQQISMQTMHADPFLKGPSSLISRTCSPPPTSPCLVPRGSYSSVFHTSR